MKFLLTFALLCLFSTGRATVWNVTVTDFEFVPSSLTISLGDTVNWTNVLGGHNVLEACGTPLFGNAVAPAPWQYSFVFSTANGVTSGTYAYVCETHPDLMWGAIRVVNAPQRVNIDVSDFQFTPADVTISTGDTVVWTRTFGLHNVHHLDDNPRFHNDIGDTWTEYVWPCTLGAGVYPYVCEIHFPDMSGTLTVEDNNPPPAPTNLVMRATNSDPTLRWNAVPGATCYLLYQSNTPNGAFTRIVGATTDTSYFYTGGTVLLPRSFLRVTALTN